jgi:hypothetical protein
MGYTAEVWVGESDGIVFVVINGPGIVCRDPLEIVQLTELWPDTLLERMRRLLRKWF